MKKAARIFTMCLIQLVGYNGFAAEGDLNNLRALAREMKLENRESVMQLMDWNDSLLLNKKRWQLPYDSLYADTLALTDEERYVIALDAAFINYRFNPGKASYALLKDRFNTASIPFPDTEPYVRELLSVMLEYSVEQGDFELSYTLSNRLHAQYYSEWKKSDELKSYQVDSLLKNQQELSRNGQNQLQKMSEIAMQWHLAAMIGFFLFTVVVIVFIVFAKRWKKQRQNLSAKADDTSEEEALVNKLEEARREIMELKLLAKKKAEVLPVAVPLPEVPASVSITPEQVAEWNDQIQQALVKIKGHCEGGKNTMSVPVYMSIVNDTTRLSAQVSKKTEEWIALLQAK